MRIAVLYGGKSREREISLRSGQAVARGLEQKGHEVILIDTRDDLTASLLAAAPDVAFIALHGKYGEDGTVQGLLELLDIPYTGSGVLTSSLCMNKLATKKMLIYEGLPTPEYVLLDGEAENVDLSGWQERIRKQLAIPVVVKAASQGSSIGTIMVRSEENLLPALEEALRYDTQVVVERLVSGVECTVPVIGNRDVRALPIIEIASAHEFYDFAAKYTPSLGKHIIPARLAEATAQTTRDLAVAAYKATGCQGFARVDFIIDPSGQPWILEINTVPGMTEVSLFPDSARAAGIDFPDLVQMIVDLALEKAERQKGFGGEEEK